LDFISIFVEIRKNTLFNSLKGFIYWRNCELVSIDEKKIAVAKESAGFFACLIKPS
jgi:hypothetical protein